MTEALRFAIYARVSTEAQEEDGESLATQLHLMSSAVTSHGGIVSTEYSVQESAMEGSDRKSLRVLLSDAAKNKFDALMVAKLDRLSRAQSVQSHFEQNLRTMGVRLFVLAEEQDLKSAEGKLSRGVLALVGEYSVNRLKWSAAASRLERAKRGWPHSGMIPFGRRVESTASRRDSNATWSLDPTKLIIVKRMFELYIHQHHPMGEVGKRLKMNPETVRRIMVEQSGPVWIRNFRDPTTGEYVEVRTQIPPLYGPEEIAEILVRRRENQRERAGWTTRARLYSLSGVLRCSNPECGWSNLSGHQTYDKASGGKAYAYYLHLSRKRMQVGCLHSVPAALVEVEILSRLGQFIRNSDDLAQAVTAALRQTGRHQEALEENLTELSRAVTRNRKVMANALEVVFEYRGTSAASLAEEKVRVTNEAIEEDQRRILEIQRAIEATKTPEDIGMKINETLFRLKGAHGHIPIHWPPEAQRLLVRLFFGGVRSTRFDRAGRELKSDRRGIFLTAHKDDGGGKYWSYEARGVIGDLTGAVDASVEAYDLHYSESAKRSFSPEEIGELVAASQSFKFTKKNFRVNSDLTRHSSG